MEEKSHLRSAIRARRQARLLERTDGFVGTAQTESTAQTKGTEYTESTELSDGTKQAASAKGIERTSGPDAFAAQLSALVTQASAKRVGCFVSVADEPDTAGFLAWALENGVEVFLPRVISDSQLEWARLSNAPMTPGAFGILEPAGVAASHQDVASLDLIFVPAAAVDRAGNRLGWGRGYFDRELSKIHSQSRRIPTYAVVFEDEVVDQLPSEPHDFPVSGAVTEARTHRFG